MKICLMMVLSLSLNLFAETVIHPVPKEPVLIGRDLLPKFKKNISPPPEMNSDLQKQDETVLQNLQKKRKKSDCERSKSEVLVSLQNFFGRPNGTLSKKEVQILTPFFDQIRNDADYYVQQLKKEFPRQRPFQYVKGITPCVPKEVTGAYPSGHSTLARLYSLILSDLMPARKVAFHSRATVIAMDRVLSGMRHPSDIKAGRELGDAVYQELKNSPAYQKAFEDFQKKLK